MTEDHRECCAGPTAINATKTECLGQIVDAVRAELVEVKQERDYWIGSTERAAARLAAIVDLCDQRPHGTTRTLIAQIRAAAQGGHEVKLTPDNARLDRWMARQAELEAEIDRLRAELAWYRDNVRCTDEGPCACNFRAVQAEARLAAVIELCDDDFLWPEGHRIQDTVRAAAQGQDSA